VGRAISAIGSVLCAALRDLEARWITHLIHPSSRHSLARDAKEVENTLYPERDREGLVRQSGAGLPGRLRMRRGGWSPWEGLKGFPTVDQADGGRSAAPEALYELTMTPT
jgi:hypothetical protein